MFYIRDSFMGPPGPTQLKPEIAKLIEELIRIGKTDDYLSERPFGGFNAQCRHIRARQIGTRLDEIGGLPLMEYAYRQVRRQLKKEPSAHLEYCWTDIGHWADFGKQVDQEFTINWMFVGIVIMLILFALYTFFGQ